MFSEKLGSGRGVSWREQETLDLLEIWGEEKVQRALSSCHRNIDLFRNISRQMNLKGHSRTALECRTKTKALRQEYRRVVTHNSKSGNGPVTCPFYDQLHRIFRGDVAILPQRVARSLSVEIAPHPPHPPPPPRQEVWDGSEDLFTEQQQPGSRIEEADMAETGCLTLEEVTEANEEDEDLTQIPDESMALAVPQSDTEEAPTTSDKDEGSLSPASRLQNARKRCRCVAMLTTLAEQMMSQSEKEEMECDRRHKETLAAEERWHAQIIEGNKVRNELLVQQAAEDRRVFLQAQSENMALLNKAVSALTALTELVVQERRERYQPQSAPVRVPVSAKESPSAEAPSKRASTRKRREK